MSCVVIVQPLPLLPTPERSGNPPNDPGNGQTAGSRMVVGHAPNTAAIAPSGWGHVLLRGDQDTEPLPDQRSHRLVPVGIVTERDIVTLRIGHADLSLLTAGAVMSHPLPADSVARHPLECSPSDAGAHDSPVGRDRRPGRAGGHCDTD